MVNWGPYVPAIQAHARREYPQESCGIIDKNGYVPLQNLAADPRKSFQMDLGQRQALAIVHSHPDGPDAPSAYDMRQQVAMGLPWIIVKVTDQGCKPPFILGGARQPLIGRRFRHGVHDCYALIQDWFASQGFGHLTPAMPRDWRWWERGQNLYLDHYAAHGWRSTRTPTVGSIGLIQTPRSPVPNHAGILLPDGWFLHHLVGKFSMRERVEAWTPLIIGWFHHPEFVWKAP